MWQIIDEFGLLLYCYVTLNLFHNNYNGMNHVKDYFPN